MDSKDAIIESLREQNRKLTALVERQAAQLELQAKEIADLKLALAKAKKDSSTSSKPPSSDITRSKARKSGSRRKPRRGGQPGHKRHLREMLPPDRVNETIDYEINAQEVDRLGLTATGEFDVIQHIELPDSLAESYDEVVAAIPHQAQLGSDETSIKDNGKKHWIWCLTAATFSLFHIAATRSREVLEQLVGPDFAGYLNFDYFSANCSFTWTYWIKAQYCWAHLIRDIRFLSEKHPDKKTKAWAEQLLDRSRRLFSAWHRRDAMTAEGFHRSMLTHRDRFLELVQQPPATKEAQNLAARFAIVEYTNDDTSDVETYDLSQDYFRFMFVEGVEPTNNHNEQQLRHSVIDRKITQGTRGEAGQRYHERMWTAIATCKKQGRSFFSFLHDSIGAKLQNQPAPSLLTV